MTVKQHDDWNPQEAFVLENQRQAYDKMREHCPVAYSKFMGWSLFRHADIRAVLADPETFSNASQFMAIPNGMDPPAHGRYHDALAGFFNEAQMTSFEPRVRSLATRLFEPLICGEAIELIEAFVTPFTFKTLCSLLGWSDQQWQFLAGWVYDNQKVAFSQDVSAGKSLADLFSNHVRTNLDAHRSAPDNAKDATAALLNITIAGEKLTDEQIVSLLRNWATGHGTVSAALGILILHLAGSPELQNQLRNDPSLIPAAIEEILRVDGPLVANRRTTTREVEIQGRTIPKGEHLTLMWIAANRDPRVFDDPEVINLERITDAGLVWGQGIHICLGAPLARIEMRVALEELLAQTKGIVLVDPAPRRAVYPSNGLETLHLRLKPSP